MIASLRRDDGGPRRFLTSLAEAHTHGIRIDWQRLLSPTKARPTPHLPLPAPTLLALPAPNPQDPAALGQTPAEHPLLGAMVALANGQGALFTGRLSLESHPWLADHAVLGTILLPGTAFLELALHAAAHTDTPVIEELTLAAPLILDEHGAVAIQVTVSGADEQGRRQGGDLARAPTLPASRKQTGPSTPPAASAPTPAAPPQSSTN